MWFINPFFLAGLGAVALPVLIHLLTRDRIRKVAFSTVRFFAKVSKRVLRRRKFQEMLLLALRMLVCALAALAFARPYIKAPDRDAGKTKANIARVILVDVSGSTDRPEARKAARDAVDRALSDLSDVTDAAALVTFADTPSVAAPMTTSPSSIKDKLDALAPTQGGTDMVAALAKADELLKPISAPKREIVLISDFQQVGWRNFKSEKLSPGIKLVTSPLPPPPADNVAVTEVVFPTSLALDKNPRSIAARIANYSAADIEGMDVTLAINGKTVQTQKINVKGGSSADVAFRHVFDTVGNNAGTVTVAHNDSVPGDNVYYFNTRVIPKIRAVIINGSPDVSPLLDGSFWLELALDPGKALVRRGIQMDPAAIARLVEETARLTTFDVQVVDAQSAKADAIKDAQVVVVANAADLPADVVGAIKSLLARGGGLLLMPGDRVKADTFNATFADLAPCKLRRPLQPPLAPGQSEPSTSLTRVEMEHPIFEEFAQPDSGNLGLARFNTYWEVTDSQLSRVLMRFDDGDRPALLERPVGAGVSMILLAGGDLRWSSFPMHATFLPYLHQTLRYLAVRSEPQTQFTVAQPLGSANDKIKAPNGESMQGGRPAMLPGFYTVGEGAAQIICAVNRPTFESDPTPIDPGEVTLKAQGPEAVATDAAKAALAAEQKKDERRLWWYTLMALVVLLMAELFVGNRTMRH